ncbi:MAG: sigma 54-interacting transcriptional regulator [Desulfovibrionales bacterium]|nr:sigma 54-interacting transcriptional regulator [Desulfovibrionales bacterium]
MDMHNVQRAWEQYVSGENQHPEGISKYVLRSWKNCKDTGVNPFTPEMPELLPTEQLEQTLAENAAFIEAAKPIMNMMVISTRSTNSITLLVSKEGVILSVEGDMSSLSPSERELNKPGCVCSEEQMGNRAVTMCVLEKRPLSFCGAEHFCKAFHSTSCYAAPIYDKDENPIGSIAVSGWTSHWHPHTLALVTAAAETISTRMREASLAKNQNRLSSMLSSLYDSLPEAILALDTEGYITHANSKASAMLQTPADELKDLHIGTLLHSNCRDDLVQLLHKRETASCDIAFVETPTGEHSLCRLQPILLPTQECVGMTLSITTQKQLVDMAKRMGGNYAIYDFHHIKGTSPKIKKNIRLARKIANSASRVLITGESGTGKELFAQAIHNNSPMRNGPFVAISCAAIPRELMEAEFFGYVGGAFTGARRQGAPGKFELASGGTLFLDEINSLPMDMQAKLLRAIQQGEIIRVGDSKPTPVQVRIIAATNQDLLYAVSDNRFREDLYYRLNVVELKLPALREHPEDIPSLTRYITKNICKEMHMPVPKITEELIAMLSSHDWPGNVRELENLIERAMILHRDGPLRFDGIGAGMPKPRTPAPTAPGKDTLTLDEITAQHIRRVLAKTGGKIHGPNGAGKRLGINPNTLRYKMRKLGIPFRKRKV